MNKYLFPLLLAAVVLLSGGAVCAQTTATDVRNGLILHYAFNGSAVDSSGNALNGTLNGTTAYVAGRNGAAQSALLLNATSSDQAYVSMPSITFDSSVYSMAAWVRSEGIGYNGDCALFHLGSSENANTGRIAYGLSYGGSGTAYISHDGSTVATTKTSHPTEGTWFHVVLTQKNGLVQIYLNGEQTLADAAIPGMSIGAKTFNWIGKTHFGVFANIAIDDFRLYNRALTAEEAITLYSGTVPGPVADVRNGLILHYPFTSNLQDATNNNLDGTPNGTTFYTAGRDGTANAALLLNQTGTEAAYVSMPSLTIDSNAYSMAAWVMIAAASMPYAWSNDCALFHLGTSENTNAGRIAYGMSYGFGGAPYVAHEGGTITASTLAHPADGNWFHVVMTQRNNEVNIYLNGVQTLLEDPATTLTTGQKTHNWIGKTHFGIYTNMAIDDFRLYNRALSPAEVDILYTGRATGNDAAVEAPAVTLMPNPTRDHVRVQTEAPVQEICVLDLTGKTLLVSAEAELNVAELPAGLYLVQVRTAQGTTVQRLVKE